MLKFVDSASLPWSARRVRAVLFDLDGTITRPVLDFDAIRREIGVEGLLLEAIARLDEAGQRRAFAILGRYERIAAETSELNDGIGDLIDLIVRAGCKIAVVTRNSRVSVDVVSARHKLRFDAIITRDDGAIKPSPQPLWAACRQMNVEPAVALWVGDGPVDRQAGLNAGIRTVIVRSARLNDASGVLVVDSPRELIGLLRADDAT